MQCILCNSGNSTRRKTGNSTVASHSSGQSVIVTYSDRNDKNSNIIIIVFISHRINVHILCYKVK